LIKPGDKVRHVSTGELGIVVHTWDDKGILDAYVAFFGYDEPQDVLAERPYILRYCTLSLAKDDFPLPDRGSAKFKIGDLVKIKGSEDVGMVVYLDGYPKRDGDVDIYSVFVACFGDAFPDDWGKEKPYVLCYSSKVLTKIESN